MDTESKEYDELILALCSAGSGTGALTDAVARALGGRAVGHVAGDLNCALFMVPEELTIIISKRGAGRAGQRKAACAISGFATIKAPTASNPGTLWPITAEREAESMPLAICAAYLAYRRTAARKQAAARKLREAGGGA